ncbi:MAG TPA: hypothetical protein V6D47_19310 [Oscillatoriaceae cyanobacterium]
MSSYSTGIAPLLPTAGYNQPTGSPTLPSNYNVSFNVHPDAYVQTATSVATTAGPVVPGAIAGHTVRHAVVHSVRRAHSIRNARYRAKAYGGRYGTSRAYKTKKTAVGTASGGILAGIKDAVKKSVIWGGLISVAINGYQLVKKQETTADAATNVAGDLVSSAAGGAVGAVASAVATPVLAGMFGPMSWVVTLGGIAAGIGGYMLCDHFLRQTSFFQGLQAKVRSMFGGGTAATTTTPATLPTYYNYNGYTG